MNETAIESHVDAAAALLGLPIDAAHRAGVVAYFALAARMAQVVDGVPLGIADEPAEAFVAIAPGDLPSP